MSSPHFDAMADRRQHRGYGNNLSYLSLIIPSPWSIPFQKVLVNSRVENLEGVRPIFQSLVYESTLLRYLNQTLSI